MLGLLLTLRETYALNRLSSFKNLRRKGGKFDHRPGRPKVLLRHCLHVRFVTRMINYNYYNGSADTSSATWPIKLT